MHSFTQKAVALIIRLWSFQGCIEIAENLLQLLRFFFSFFLGTGSTLSCTELFVEDFDSRHRISLQWLLSALHNGASNQTIYIS